jgi:predicted O-methyltransferase YrrM
MSMTTTLRRTAKTIQRRVLPLSDMDRAYSVHGWTDWGQLSFLRNAVFDLGPGSKVVEVGVWAGRSAIAMALAGRARKVTVYAIDPWQDYEQEHVEPSTELKGAGVSSFQELYELYLSNVKRLNADNIVTLRDSGVEAARKWQFGPVDVVFIDGNHDYEPVREDIQAWLKHLKPGGLLSGDDWNWDGVQRAVNEALASMPGTALTLPTATTWAVRLP